MAYKVLNSFKDTDDSKHKYKAGDNYPREGYTPSQKRISELTRVHPQHKKKFIEEVKQTYTKSNLKQLKKDDQEKLIKDLKGDPESVSNEDERINLIMDLQSE